MSMIWFAISLVASRRS